MAKIEDNIVPVKVAYLAEYLSNKKHISLREALLYIYFNPMYEDLYDERAKWWYLDTESLYFELEKRRKEAVKPLDFRIFEFFVYCLERYAAWKGISSLQTMALFNEKRVDDFILDSYDLLHTQDISFILEDIERFIKKRR